MSEQERQAFFERYAPLAMEQQQKYGIPASVTLSQMALESGFGCSRLAREGNNFFGVKAGAEWVRTGKPFGYYNDDKPNEKFRHYANAEASLLDHSKVLMQKNYRSCWQHDSADYHNWLVGIKAGGYATAPNYVAANESIIKRYGLARYDAMAKADAQQKGIAIGYMRGKSDSGMSAAEAPRYDMASRGNTAADGSESMKEPIVDTKSIDQSQLLMRQAAYSGNPVELLNCLMARNKDTDKDGLSFGGGDILADFVGMIMKSAISLAAMVSVGEPANDAADNANAVDATIQPDTLIERQRQGIDPSRARNIAAMNYDSLAPEQSQGQSQKLA